MSIEVQIPLSLQIDPALAGQPISHDVSQAVSAAVARALTEMDSELIAPRGGDAWPIYNVPEFTWGAQAAAQNPLWKRQIAVEVHRAISDAVMRSPQSAADAVRGAPNVMPGNPSEPYDARRVRGDSYMLQSYNGEVPAADIPISITHFNSSALRDLHETHGLTLWRFEGSLDALGRRIGGYLADQPQGLLRQGATQSVLYLGTDDRGEAGWIVAVFTVGEIAEDNVSINMIRRFSIGGKITNIKQDGINSASGSINLGQQCRLLKGRPVANSEELSAAIAARFFRVLDLPSQAPSNETTEQAGQREMALRLAQESAQTMVYQTGFLGDFEYSGTSLMCTFPQLSFSGSSLSMIPVYRVRELPAEGDGEGGGAGGEDEDGGGNAGTGNSDAETADGGVGQRRSILGEVDPNAPAFDGPTRFYPTSPNGDAVEIDLGPFMGEPSLDELGETGDHIRRKIRQIAFRLEMPEGNYCGAFCIAAAQMVGIRAASVANYTETSNQATTIATGDTGNLGSVQMPTELTPAIRVIRYVAEVVPLMTDLQHFMVDIYNIPRIASLITGRRANDPSGWALDFYKAYTPALKSSVGHTFIRTCQIKMLELLRHSEKHINTRLLNFDTYYRMVRSQILGMIATEAKLHELLAMLTEAAAKDNDFGANVAEVYSSWRSARHALSMSLSDQILNLSQLDPSGREVEGTVASVAGVLRVTDADGRVWTKEELEQAIASVHGAAASIDPLIHQFRDIPEVVQTFRENPRLSRWYLKSLLGEMKQKNMESQVRTRSDNMFAFRAGKIREDLPNRTIPHTDIALQGIHLMAHEAIGDAFGGSRAYAIGVQYVMNVELGRQGLITFGETVSVIALAVVCPPAAAALGAVYAVVHYQQASEIDDLYGGLIDPELILNRAEVEFDLFMSEFEIALSVIPELGSVVRGAVTVGRTVGRNGAVAGVRALSTRARRELLVSVGHAVKAGITRSLVREVLMDRGMALILPQVLGPLMMEINRTISVTTGRRVAPRGATAPPAGDAEQTPLLEDENALIERLREYQEGDRDEDLPDASEAP